IALSYYVIATSLIFMSFQLIRSQPRSTLFPYTTLFRSLGVKASGCSGYKYVLDWVENLGEDDREFKIAEGVSVFVDSKSLPFVNGTELDFVKEGLNSMFRFNNPNVASECGCGESFSIA